LLLGDNSTQNLHRLTKVQAIRVGAGGARLVLCCGHGGGGGWCHVGAASHLGFFCVWVASACVLVWVVFFFLRFGALPWCVTYADCFGTSRAAHRLGSWRLLSLLKDLRGYVCCFGGLVLYSLAFLLPFTRARNIWAEIIMSLLVLTFPSRASSSPLVLRIMRPP